MRYVGILAIVALTAAPSAIAAEGVGTTAPADREARVERQPAADVAASARETRSAVDAYLASSTADGSLVGGPGQAGYDGGFWIRGGSFLLKLNLTLQARWEGFDWDDQAWEPRPGGDLSGFSLPRATLKLSGDATCDVHYYAELEFGHAVGAEPARDQSSDDLDNGPTATVLREAWVEYEACAAATFRMGILRTATTRQLMTAPELQQFVDVSLASSFLGVSMPGWSDRNRDYGFMVHGAFGCDRQLSYLATVTNGDGVAARNVLDGATSDNFAYSARVNWDVRGHLGYEEGALRQTECGWAGAVGAWVHYYADHAREKPLITYGDRLTWGVDAAFGWGGFSMTAAYSAAEVSDGDVIDDASRSCWLVQVGYLFPGSAWELAARYSAFEFDPGFTTSGTSEMAGAVTYYIDGHADKVTLDVSWLTVDDNFGGHADVYPGYSRLGESDALLVRLQWQLAL